MIGKVFRIFREKGGALKALDLWEWFESLEPRDQKKATFLCTLAQTALLEGKHEDKVIEASPLSSLRGFTQKEFLIPSMGR